MKKPFLTIAVILIVGCLSYVLWGGLEENLVYFVTPTELADKGKSAVDKPVRLGGMAHEIEMVGAELRFVVKDEAHTIPVSTKTTPPQMFHEGIGVVVEGSLQDDGRFHAERL